MSKSVSSLFIRTFFFIYKTRRQETLVLNFTSWSKAVKYFAAALSFTENVVGHKFVYPAGIYENYFVKCQKKIRWHFNFQV